MFDARSILDMLVRGGGQPPGSGSSPGQGGDAFRDLLGQLGSAARHPGRQSLSRRRAASRPAIRRRCRGAATRTIGARHLLLRAVEAWKTYCAVSWAAAKATRTGAPRRSAKQRPRRRRPGGYAAQRSGRRPASGAGSRRWRTKAPGGGNLQDMLRDLLGGGQGGSMNRMVGDGGQGGRADMRCSTC